MKFISLIGSAALIWIVLGLILIFYEEIEHHKFILIFIISLVVVFITSNFVLKNIIRRERPLSKYIVDFIDKSNEDFVAILFPHSKLTVKPYNNSPFSYPNDYSFPSGHASSAFTAATILSYFHKKRRAVFYLIALLISFSRVYLGYHYLFDVLAGAFMGYLISKLIIYVYSKWIK